MAIEEERSSSGVIPDPGCEWIEWCPDSSEAVARKVSGFEPLDTGAGRAAAEWLKENARRDVFTVTYLLVSAQRVEGFITCRVSEATLTWSGVKRVGGGTQDRKTVPAYLLCWCAKHRGTAIDGEELLLNAIRLGRELRAYGCAVLALDPHDEESSAKVWQRKHGFRIGASASGDGRPTRLWLPLDTEEA